MICSKWGYDKKTANELAYRTFNKLWVKPSYDDSKRKYAVDYDEGVKFYLYSIAKHELTNIYRENNDPNPYNGEESIIRDFPDLQNFEIDDPNPCNEDESILWDFPADLENIKTERKEELEERKEIMDMALGSLSPKHKIIYLTYLIHSKPGKNLPGHLLKALREELGLAQGTIRFYNFEAIRTVNNYLKIWELKKV